MCDVSLIWDKLKSMNCIHKSKSHLCKEEWNHFVQEYHAEKRMRKINNIHRSRDTWVCIEYYFKKYCWALLTTWTFGINCFSTLYPNQFYLKSVCESCKNSGLQLTKLSLRVSWTCVWKDMNVYMIGSTWFVC